MEGCVSGRGRTMVRSTVMEPKRTVRRGICLRDDPTRVIRHVTNTRHTRKKATTTKTS